MILTHSMQMQLYSIVCGSCSISLAPSGENTSSHSLWRHQWSTCSTAALFQLNFLLLLEREIKLKVVFVEFSILFSHVAQSALCSVQLHELQDMGGSCSSLFETSAHQWDHWGHGSPKHNPNVSNAGRASMNSTCASGIQWLYDERWAIGLMLMIIDTSIVKQVH